MSLRCTMPPDGYEATWRSRQQPPSSGARIRAALASAGQRSRLERDRGRAGARSLTGCGSASAWRRSRPGRGLRWSPFPREIVAAACRRGSRCRRASGRARASARSLSLGGAGGLATARRDHDLGARARHSARRTLVAARIDDAGRALLDATDAGARRAGAYALAARDAVRDGWSRVPRGEDDPAWSRRSTCTSRGSASMTPAYHAGP